MYFPCQFAAVTDTSPNPISGYFPLKCCNELLNMFYKLAPQKKHYPALFRDKASQQQKTHRMTWTDEKTEKAQHSFPVKVLEQMNKIPPLQRCRLSSYILGCGHLSPQLSRCIRCLDAFFLVTHTWAQHENPYCQRDTVHVAYNQISRHCSLCDSPKVLRDWLPCQRSDFLALSSCSRGLAFQKSLASPIHPVHQAHSPGNSIPALSSLCFSSTCSKWGHHLLFPLQTQALTRPCRLQMGCPAPFWAEPAGTRYLNFHAVSPCLLGSPLLFFLRCLL